MGVDDRALVRIIQAFPDGITKEEAGVRLNKLSALKKGTRNDREQYNSFLVTGWKGLMSIREIQMKETVTKLKANGPAMVANESLRGGNPDCPSCWGAKLKGKTMSGPV